MAVLFKSLMATLAVLLLLAVGTYFLVGASFQPLDDTARANAPGAFLETSHGKLHYRWHGPEDGNAIIMAHGFSTPNFIFEQNAEALASAGFRVLTFDHFGRGWSDRPSADYTPDFYDAELLALADGLSLDTPFGLVGLSMGGPIAAEFTARHPERVTKLFLFVPAGLKLGTENGSLSDRLLRAPLIGDWVWRVFGKRLLLGDSQYDETARASADRLAGDVSVQMGYKGYFEALLSSYRHLPMQDRDEIYARLDATGVPMRAVFGEKDTTVLIESADRLANVAPNADIIRLDEGEHGLNYQMHTVTNPLLIEFFADASVAD